MMKRLTAFFSGIFIFALLLPFPAGQAHAQSSASCTQYMVPVTLSSIDPTVYHVATWLCAQGSPVGKTVQVLVHGATYDHNYWDFPYNLSQYSYVQQITGAGYATLNIDRIGNGLSDHPPAASVTVLSDVYILHQLIQDLRNGSVYGASFSKILLVGHSFGSLISVTEAAQYADVDGVMATGLMHTFNTTGMAALVASFYPTSLDPKFASSNLPTGYLTTMPGTRQSDFYNPADAAAAVIAQDESLKQTLTDSELATFAAGLGPTSTLPIHVPVLVAVGGNDAAFCGLLLSCATNATIVSREALFYAPQTCLEGYVLPSAGHSINLHSNAGQWFQAAIDWANRRIGTSSSNPPTQPCQ